MKCLTVWFLVLVSTGCAVQGSQNPDKSVREERLVHLLARLSEGKTINEGASNVRKDGVKDQEKTDGQMGKPVERGEIADKLQHIAELKRKPQLSGEHDDQLKKKSDVIYKEEKTLENREEQLLMRELHEIIEDRQLDLPNYREDGRCGPEYPGPNGEEGICLGDGIYPCCSTGGWCGNTDEHCDIYLHRDYRTDLPDWRDDGRCGPLYLGPNGQEGICLANGMYPCCSTFGWCGNTHEHCVTSLYRDFRLPVPSSSTQVRLEGGNGVNEGRVEIFYHGVWGTVCDDGWGDEETAVVCRELGFLDTNVAVTTDQFGQGDGRIWLDDVSCTGYENQLSGCSHSGFGNHNCGHHEDVGVICGDTSTRLSGGTNPSNGRVEVYRDGAWGTVCDDGWGDEEAVVVCRELGFADAEVISTSFGEGDGRILLDNVVCTGSEQQLSECSHNGLGVHNCGHHEDVGVICREAEDTRLVGGDNAREGRLEIFHDGVWGSICDDSWSTDNAKVACRELGLPDGDAQAISRAHFGQGEGEIWLDNVFCDGYESQLIDCPHNGWGIHNCGHDEDAGVVCRELFRLVGGSNANEGRLEVLHEGIWGSVCDDSWDHRDAAVVCAQLGMPSDNAQASYYAQFGEGTGPIWLDDVLCSGSESQLGLCEHNGWGTHNCGHSEDAGVICADSTK